jgi:hypothetical protein
MLYNGKKRSRYGFIHSVEEEEHNLQHDSIGAEVLSTQSALVH